MDLTPLEFRILEMYHHKYEGSGFPEASEIVVTARENTGAGRFTYLDCPAIFEFGDGELPLGTYQQFDMTCLFAGASFFLQVKDGKPNRLEIVVNGEFTWDGRETEWTMLDPETALPIEQ